MCTDLCSRNLLGHPIEPHKLMRAIASGNADDRAAFLGAFSCSSCGLCEMYACGQGLNPRTLINEIKGELRKGGITPPRGVEADPVNSTREYRKVPMSRLTARLGLAKYDLPAPIVDVEITSRRLKIKLAQNIGAPSVACVKVGDTVSLGDVLGHFTPDKLGTSVHAPMAGRVVEVSEQFVVLEA
jgi:Na+-translocating ferredoxin:NAD+ oxidoreductase RnfC subunit